jgi:hypothetical protein
MPRVLSSVLVGILAAAPLAWSVPARAGNEEMKTCAAAAEKAQRFRNDGKLKDAREQLVVCARNVCPGVIRKDCEPWLSELDTRLPTLVISAKDGAGKDLVDIRVTIDGALVASKLDGKAIPIDPGPHTFKYERDGSAAVETNVVVREGEKGRVLDVVFDPQLAKKEEAVPEKDKDKDKDKPAEKAGAPIGGFVFAGIGALAVGSFVFFDLSAKSSADNLRSTCAPHCAQSDVDSVNSKLIIADVSLGAGLVALGVATWLLVSHYGSAKPNQVQIGLGGVGARF